MKPVYTHDCDKCVFLATNSEEDLYVHQRSEGRGSEVIGRYGNEGSEYACYPVDVVDKRFVELMGPTHWAPVAVALAKWRGLVK